MWERTLENFVKWLDDAKSDPTVSLKALKIIRVLLTYTMQFCDAEEVLKKVDDIAKGP